MANQTYIYHGPPSGMTLREASGRTREVLLHPDQDVRLPADHPHVQALVARRLLVPVAEPDLERSAAARPPAEKPATRSTPSKTSTKEKS